jgi:hypothetical protein
MKSIETQEVIIGENKEIFTGSAILTKREINDTSKRVLKDCSKKSSKSKYKKAKEDSQKKN